VRPAQTEGMMAVSVLGRRGLAMTSPGNRAEASNPGAEHRVVRR
jgi:hypothetical protein